MCQLWVLALRSFKNFHLPSCVFCHQCEKNFPWVGPTMNTCGTFTFSPSNPARSMAWSTTPAIPSPEEPLQPSCRCMRNKFSLPPRFYRCLLCSSSWLLNPPSFQHHSHQCHWCWKRKEQHPSALHFSSCWSQALLRENADHASQFQFTLGPHCALYHWMWHCYQEP